MDTLVQIIPCMKENTVSEMLLNYDEFWDILIIQEGMSLLDAEVSDDCLRKYPYLRVLHKIPVSS